MNDHSLKEWIIDNRKVVFWGLFLLLLGWALYAVKEITALLLLAYGIALLIDPLVDRLEKLKVRRSFSIILICVAFIVGFVTLSLFAIPILIREYSTLIASLPRYIEGGGGKLQEILHNRFGIEGSLDLEVLVTKAKEVISAIDVDQMRNVTGAIQSTVLSGYSFALTVVNLAFLPFFVYYIACDIDSFHRVVVGTLPANVRPRVVAVAKEIMSHVYSFFKGQITVSCTMAVLYAIGLSIVGLPSGLIVGTIAGLLNVVPYLGVAIGFVLAAFITVVNDFTWLQLGKVIAVFAVVQGLEGMVLTPRIVGKSVGLHPLGVMLALVVGAQLFGLLGLVLAIPGAAAVRVLFRQARELVDSYDEEPDLVEEGME